jgi:hypothetical protein
MRGPVPWAQGMKLHAAGIAAIGGHSQDAFQREQRAFHHAVARNLLQIRIPAPGAMRAEHQAKRNAVSMEARFARRAPPGEHADEAHRVLDQIPASRSPAVASLADWANQGSVPQKPASWAPTVQSSKRGKSCKGGNGRRFHASRAGRKTRQTRAGPRRGGQQPHSTPV